MTESYNIYCVSNASKEIYNKNTLTSFSNLLPKNFDLKNKQWEIGIVKFGFQFNPNQSIDKSLVSISTDVVMDSFDNDSYSTLVYITCLKNRKKISIFIIT